MCKLFTPQDFNKLTNKQRAVLKLIVTDCNTSPQIPLTNENANIGLLIWDSEIEAIYFIHNTMAAYHENGSGKLIRIKRLMSNGLFDAWQNMNEKDYNKYTIIGQVDDKKLSYLYTLITELNHF